jgi:hypothetical protein
MMPLFVTVRADGRRRIQLHLPLFLIWLLLLLILVVATPLILLLALLAPVRIWRGSRAILSLISAVRGTRVEMIAPGRSLLMHVW